MKKTSSSISDQFESNDIQCFNVDLHYLLFRFLNSPVDNFERIYYDAYNKSSQLVIFHIQVILRIFFNKRNNDICNFTVDQSFEDVLVSNLGDAQSQRQSIGAF